MTYDDQTDIAHTRDTVEVPLARRSRVVRRAPETVIERRPVRQTYVRHSDPVASAQAASQLIWTIVWSIVVLTLLFVGLWALHVYLHLF